MLGQDAYLSVIDAIISLAKQAAKDPWDIPEKDSEITNLPKLIEDEYGSKFSEAYKLIEKQKRVEKLNQLRSEIEEKHLSDTLTSVIVSDSIKSVEKDIVRGDLLKTGNRIDERQDPIKSTHAAAKYFKDLYEEFEDWYLVLLNPKP